MIGCYDFCGHYECTNCGTHRLTTPAVVVVVAAGGLVGDELIVVGGTDDVANVARHRTDLVHRISVAALLK